MDVTLPALGENVEEGEVLSVLVAAGDRVEKDQPLVELETDKATVEVPAPCGGVVREVRVQQGERLRVGQSILALDTDGEAPAVPEKSNGASDEPTPVPERPAAGGRAETRSKGTTDAAVPSPAAASDDDTVPSGSSSTESAPAAPSVRRLARELGIDIAGVAGSGPGGRISAEDVKRHGQRLIGRAPAPATGPAEPALPDFSRWGEIQREGMSGIRRTTAAAMSRSWATIPHVTQFDRADVTELDAARRQLAARVEPAGGKLTITAIVLKVVASALGRFPKFNASLDSAREEIVFKRFTNVGVAVDTEHGLLVPVVRDADRKNVTEIAAELVELSERARRRKLGPDELGGATFTVTNLGGLGTTYFSPIINWPQVAVLGLGRAAIEAVHDGGAFVPRLVLPLSVSYDHRLIDGAEASRFLRWIAEALEQPLLLALEG